MKIVWSTLLELSWLFFICIILVTSYFFINTKEIIVTTVEGCCEWVLIKLHLAFSSCWIENCDLSHVTKKLFEGKSTPNRREYPWVLIWDPQLCCLPRLSCSSTLFIYLPICFCISVSMSVCVCLCQCLCGCLSVSFFLFPPPFFLVSFPTLDLQSSHFFCALLWNWKGIL